MSGVGRDHTLPVGVVQRSQAFACLQMIRQGLLKTAQLVVCQSQVIRLHGSLERQPQLVTLLADVIQRAPRQFGTPRQKLEPAIIPAPRSFCNRVIQLLGNLDLLDKERLSVFNVSQVNVSGRRVG